MLRRTRIRERVYFEWMRIIACGLVIFNHLNGYTLYMISTGVKQGFYMCLTMITRINVPLFFMIFGALLLRKTEDFTTVIKKRTCRFCLVIFIFELGLYVEYYLNVLRKGWGSDFAIKQFVREVFAGQVSGIILVFVFLSGISFHASTGTKDSKRNEKARFLYAIDFTIFVVFFVNGR